MGSVASLKCATEEGQIKGSQSRDDFKNEISVRSARHLVKSKISIETGMPKGIPGDGRSFTDFVITKKIDQASPYLQKALRDNSVFTEWRLMFHHIPTNGPETKYASVTLSKAKISSIKMIMPNFGIPANKPAHEYEEVSFQFEEIGWGMTKHESDPSPGNNPPALAEVGCIPEPDWALVEIKMLVMGFPKLVSSAKKVLWEEWKTRNPGKEIPPEYAKD